MSNISLFEGAHACDASNLQGKLVDLSSKQKRGLRTDLEDFENVKAEILTQFPLKGAAAGIPQDVFDSFVNSNAIVAQIDAKIAEAKKLVEVLTDTRAYYVSARQNDISMVADALESRARRKKDVSILAPFPKTLKYAAQVGVKAAKTRKDNLKAKAATTKDTTDTNPTEGEKTG